MGRSLLQGTAWHYEYLWPKSKKKKKKTTSKARQKKKDCKFKKDGLCTLNGFVNKGLQCKRPSTCRYYSK